VPPRWLYAEEMHATEAPVSFARLTHTDARTAALRPFSAAVGVPGQIAELVVMAPLDRATTLIATGMNYLSGVGPSTSSGMSAGVLVPTPRFGGWRATYSMGFLQEPGGSKAAWMRLGVALETGRFLVAAAAASEHAFAPGRDAVDVLAIVGIDYRLASAVRLGAEYVAQDFEGLVDPEELEGVRHFAGPHLAFVPIGGRVSVIVGSAWGLSPSSPTTLTRLAIASTF
jgi:hypothetical protein